MNSVNTRRWQAFKANRRAFWALRIFLAFFIISLCAELVANDRPIVVSYKGELNFPIVQELSETDFGGDLDLPADFRDPFIMENIEKEGWALWPPIRYSFNTVALDPSATFPLPPSAENWLGTDDHGRDVLARILYGFRLSVLFGLCLAVVGSLAGMAAGVMQGYYGGPLDLLFQRFMEIWGGIPVLYLIIIISSSVVMDFWILLGIMLLFGWMRLVGVVRAESLRTRNMDYVRAARALGVPDRIIMFRHVLPNAVVAVVAMMPFVVNGSIITLTSLDFLGFGLPPGYPSLGELVAQGKNNLFAPWIGLTAFIVLAGMLACLVLIGEGARDAFDPRVFQARDIDDEAPMDSEEGTEIGGLKGAAAAPSRDSGLKGGSI